MSGTGFVETLRRHWIALTLWALGIASMALYIILVIPDMKTLQQYGDLIKNMPSFLLNALGASDAASIGTPAGFLGYGFFGWIMLVMATYGVIYGLDITANDEERGIMDILLSMPLPRWRIVLEKFLAYTVGVIVIAVTSLVVLLWGINQSAALQSITAGQVVASSFNFIPATLIVMAFTAAIATLVRRRSAAAAIAAVFVIASWFVDFIGRSAPSMDGVRAFSFFKYYDASSVIVHGLVVGNVLGVLIVAVALVAGAVWLFERRDVGV